jgi:hypothetical protein
MSHSHESPIRTMPTEPPTERMVELEATNVLAEPHLRNSVIRARHQEPTPEETAEYEEFIRVFMSQPR